MLLDKVKPVSVDAQGDHSESSVEKVGPLSNGFCWLRNEPVPGFIDMLRGIVLLMLDKFPLQLTPCNKIGICKYSTILKLIRETKSRSIELEVGRNEDR